MGTGKNMALIADDDKSFLGLLKIALARALGMEVACVEDGEKALAAVEELKPDLIFLDIIMPKLTGLEVIKALAGSGAARTIPVIVVSAVSINPSTLRDLEGMPNFGAFLRKPVRMAETIALTAQLLAGGPSSRN